MSNFTRIFVMALVPIVFLVDGNVLSLLSFENAPLAPANPYVGSARCKECHEGEYERFTKSSKMSHSFNSIKLLRKGLTEQEINTCYSCHTTGYGQLGGFVSEKDTPELKNNGCETCHGAGGKHVESSAIKDILAKPTIKQCEFCHNESRSQAFNYKPMLFGGSH